MVDDFLSRSRSRSGTSYSPTTLQVLVGIFKLIRVVGVLALLAVVAAEGSKEGEDEGAWVLVISGVRRDSIDESEGAIGVEGAGRSIVELLWISSGVESGYSKDFAWKREWSSIGLEWVHCNSLVSSICIFYLF